MAGDTGEAALDVVFEHEIDAIESLLRLVAGIVRQRGREILNRFDITPPQFDALLRLLRANETLTMGELCQRLFLASSTVTDLVDRMEKNELVRRARDPEDRRVVRIIVLDKGRRVHAEVMRERRAYLGSILETTAARDRERLVAALTRLHDLMTAADPTGGEPR